MSGLIIVCGLAAEARIARGTDEVAVVAGGGDSVRLLRELDANLPAAILSFGVAGGLAAGLGPGAVRVASAIAAPDGARLPVDETWAAALAGALAVPRAVVAGVDAALADIAGKAALHRVTGADLVDMESHVAARWAAGHGVRFAAVRVVTDPAERALPHAATVGMRADGKVDLPAILRSLARDPGQLPGLIRTGRDAKTAFAALLRCRQCLGPRFALLDLGDPLLNVP